MKGLVSMVKRVCLLLGLLLLLPPCAEAKEKKERPAPDAKELILGHLKDSYEWHFLTVNDSTHITIPLPIIVCSRERGWFAFNSNHLLHGDGHYKGFYLADSGLSEGKVVERNSEGKEVRPFDISITKNVVGIFFSCGLLIWVVLGMARWYRKREKAGEEDVVPGGLLGFMESFIMDIEESVIKKCVGKEYRRYSPFLLTIFFFIFFTNILGLIPIFPAGANLTGNIAVTCGLAICTFIAVNVFGSKAYWKEVLWPDVPIFMKAPIPIMPIIEIFGLFTKPMALMIRLFANIFAGHCIILALTSLVFLTVSMGPAINGSMSVVSVLFSVFMLVLELLVAYIQAYVFTILSAIFIGLSRPNHQKKEKQIVTNNIKS